MKISELEEKCRIALVSYGDMDVYLKINNSVCSCKKPNVILEEYSEPQVYIKSNSTFYTKTHLIPLFLLEN